MTVDIKKPALFVPVEKKEIDKARYELENGSKTITFYTDSNRAGIAANSPINTVYFKIKGENFITFSADLLKFEWNSYKNPQHEHSFKKYRYEFNKLTQLGHPKAITDLMDYSTHNYLINSTPGVCVICDPAID